MRAARCCAAPKVYLGSAKARLALLCLLGRDACVVAPDLSDQRGCMNGSAACLFAVLWTDDAPGSDCVRAGLGQWSSKQLPAGLSGGLATYMPTRLHSRR